MRQLKEKIEDRIGVSEDNECLHLDLCVWGRGEDDDDDDSRIVLTRECLLA